MNGNKFPPHYLGKLVDPKFIFGQHLEPIENLILQMYDEDKFSNLSLQLPIRHSKTTYLILIAFWLLIHNPEERIIIASFSKDAAKEILTKVRNALLAYGKIINNIEIDPNNCRSDYFKIGGHIGEARAVSIGTRFSHATANTILCDDILTEESARSPVQRKSIEDWFFDTLLNRRTKSSRGNPKIITTMTPRHPADILNTIEKNNKYAIGQDKWVIYRKSCLENGIALFPELWPVDALKAKRKELEEVGKSYVWSTLWMCDPCNDPTAIEYPPSYFVDIVYKNDIQALRSYVAIDTASGKAESGDFSVIVKIIIDKEYKVYVEDSICKRIPITEFEDACAAFIARHNPDAILVEINNETGFPDHLYDKCFKQYGIQPYINTIRNTINKEVRIRRELSPLLYQKRLKFADTQDNMLILAQTTELFSGKNDDGPDALAMALKLAREDLKRNVL